MKDVPNTEIRDEVCDAETKKRGKGSSARRSWTKFSKDAAPKIAAK